jgi:hypothetical protein
MTLAERQQAIWTGALGALIIFSFISGPIWFYSEGPPQPCEAELSALMINVQVNETPQMGVTVKEATKTLEPIEVRPGDLVEIIVELELQPEMCVGNFLIDWKLSFNSGLAKVETMARLPAEGELSIKVGSRTEDNLIEFMVRDTSNHIKKKISLPLKVKEQ